MPNPNPVEGAPEELEAQGTLSMLLQAAATADGNGTVANTDGFNGAQMIELQKTGTGTCTLTIEGSYDGTTWYTAGSYQVDANGTLTRTAAGISVGAGAVNHVYQVLDLYPFLRARISATAGAIVAQVRLYACPT